MPGSDQTAVANLTAGPRRVVSVSSHTMFAPFTTNTGTAEEAVTVIAYAFPNRPLVIRRINAQTTIADSAALGIELAVPQARGLALRARQIMRLPSCPYVVPTRGEIAAATHLSEFVLGDFAPALDPGVAALDCTESRPFFDHPGTLHLRTLGFQTKVTVTDGTGYAIVSAEVASIPSYTAAAPRGCLRVDTAFTPTP